MNMRMCTQAHVYARQFANKSACTRLINGVDEYIDEGRGGWGGGGAFLPDEGQCLGSNL